MNSTIIFIIVTVLILAIALVIIFIRARSFDNDEKIIEKKYGEVDKIILEKFENRNAFVDYLIKLITYERFKSIIAVSSDSDMYMMNVFSELAEDVYKKLDDESIRKEDIELYISMISTKEERLYAHYIDVYYTELDKNLEEAEKEEAEYQKKLEEYGQEPDGDPELHKMNPVMFASSKMQEGDGKIIGEFPRENSEYKSITELQEYKTIEDL